LTDLTAINTVSTSPLAIAVNPRLNVKNLRELLALSRTRQVSMGLPLAGSLSHLVTEMTGQAIGIEFLNVPYKGAAPAIADVIAGHVDATVSDVGPLLPMHREGRVRIIMVSSEKRIPALPDVRTADEDAKGLVMTNWIGIFGPANLPKPIVEKLDAALKKIITRDDVRAHYQKASVTASALAGPEAFQRFASAEYLRYGRIVRERKIVLSE
jgi:tripartite-type tricarboxylate transporter receptor subunit TctC